MSTSGNKGNNEKSIVSTDSGDEYNDSRDQALYAPQNNDDNDYSSSNNNNNNDQPNAALLNQAALDLDHLLQEIKETTQRLYHEMATYAQTCHEIQQMWQEPLQNELKEARRLDQVELDVKQATERLFK